MIDAEPKSISHNHTFGEDTSDTEVLHSMLSHLSQKACKRLREAGLSTRTLTLTIRYQGFDTYTRARTLAAPTNLDSDIFATIQSLFHEHRNLKRKVRLLGVALGSFSQGNDQLDLLEAEKRTKLERLAKTADGLRDRFGFDSVQFGGSIRHEERNANEGWGQRETRRKNETEDKKQKRKTEKNPANESDFYPD